MSSLNFEECVHKILKLNIREGQEKEVCIMLLDCCAMEKMFNRFFCLQAARLCSLNQTYQTEFELLFHEQLSQVHRLETNKLRNIGKFFSHLLETDMVSWNIFDQIFLSEDTTTSSLRIFLKVIFQDLSHNWGIKKLNQRFNDPDYIEHFGGLFPR